MLKRLMVLLAVVGIVIVFAAQSSAQQQGAHEGTVVSAGDGKLVMKTDDGQQHSHSIDGSVQIIVHGQPGKLEDLQEGMRVRVMTNQDGKVTSVSTVDTRK